MPDDDPAEQALAEDPARTPKQVEQRLTELRRAMMKRVSEARWGRSPGAD